MKENIQDNTIPTAKTSMGNYGLDFNVASQKATLLLEDQDYSYLMDPKFTGQRNLLPMMYLNGRSEHFIRKIFNNSMQDLRIGKIDNLRIIAYLTDEGTALSYLNDELSPPDVKDAVFDYMLQKRLPALKTNDEILEELREARKRFDEELNYLKEERQSTMDFYNTYFKGLKEDQNTVQECIQESAERASKLVASEKEQEIKELKAELEACKKERDQAITGAEEFKNKEIGYLNDLFTHDSDEDEPSVQFSKAGAEEKADIQEKDPVEKNKPVSIKSDESKRVKRKFSKREDLKRAELLVDAIADESRSKEQFDVIADAYKRGLSYKGLEKLTRIKTPLENFKIMEKIMVRNELGVEALKE